MTSLLFFLAMTKLVQFDYLRIHTVMKRFYPLKKLQFLPKQLPSLRAIANFNPKHWYFTEL